MNEFPAADSLGKIAVVGMAGRYPDAWNIEQFWNNLKEGRECITFFTDEELLEAGANLELLSRPDYVKAAGVCPGTFLFDASFFGYTPREAEFLDPQHRVFLECVWEALEHAGYDAWTYPGRIGLFAGSGATQYLFELLCIPGIHKLADAFTLSTCADRDFLATRVGYKLNLRGPCLSVQTACSTSLVSIVMACQSLLSYQSDIAMGGGVTLLTREKQGYFYQEGGIHSPDGHCRAFDADAQGIAGGTGAGVVVLKRLEDALADRDTIHAVILGTGLNNDGSARIGFSAPGVNGQVAVSSDAIAMAGISPETIGFVECHGTATPLGDPIEITALTRSFRAYTQKRNFCAVGSVKTNIGHTDTAAGVAGFTKVVLSLKNKLIPANLHFRRPNPDIDFASSPFYVNTELKEWIREGPPRRASVSSFGLGGTNAHVILEEAPEQETSPVAPWNVLVWSARTAPALEKMSANLLEHFKANDEDSISDVAYTLQAGRRVFPHRQILVCRDREDAIAALETPVPGRLLVGHREREAGPVAFLFSGQGGQHINMGKELYSHERVFREQVDLCAELLKPELELDLRELLYPAAEKSSQAVALLDQTRYTTPILFTIEYALAKLWLEWGVRPAAVIGHSLGEYAAACIAGVFSLEDALRLVSARGRLIQQLPGGCMTGVLLPEAHLAPLLAAVSGISLAAINGPSACVVSGDERAMEELERILAERLVQHRRLHISHAYHSPMVDPILDDFRKEIQKVTLSPACIPYVSNVSGTWITTSDVADPEYWVRHMRQEVRFADGLAELLKEPQRILLEVGPGRTLGSLAGQHPNRGAEHVILPSLPHPKNDLQGDREFILTTAAQLWLEGLRIHWTAFHNSPRRRIPLPTYPFERQHYQLKGTLGAQKPAPVGQASISLSESHSPAAPSNGKHSSAPISAVHPRPNLPIPCVEPRNELERAIAGIWEDTLGIDAPGVHDSFFALGGHSLLALQIIARVRDLFETEFTVANLYQAPTIAGLSEAVVRQLNGNMDPETGQMIDDVDGSSQETESVTSDVVTMNLQPEKPSVAGQARHVNTGIAAPVAGFSVERLKLLAREIKKRKGEISAQGNTGAVLTTPLVPIRTSGSNLPLFLVHPVGGGVVAYHDLAKYLRTEQPVYALQNLDSGNQEDHESLRIEEMAARYIDVIKTVQHNGPYFLGGSSMGGAVAFEMAVQLRAQGGQVSLVAMLDTPAKIIPHMEGHAGQNALAIELVMLASIIASEQTKGFQLLPGELERLEEVEQIDYVLQKLQQQQLAPATLSASAFRAALMAFVKNLNAFEKYVPRTYGGRVVLLRATESSSDMKESAGNLCDDPTFGWQAYCAQPVIVRFVPGDHVRMNLEPAVRFAGAELQRCLDEARES